MTTTTTAFQSVTIGQGATVHTGYYSTDGETLYGSLCNAFAWERSRVRETGTEANCPKCAKITTDGSARVGGAKAVAA